VKPQSRAFKKLVKFIRDRGYTVDTKFETAWDKYPGYWYARITGKSIMGGFCDPSEGMCYWYINGRIAFDNKKCFDKWSKCPYSLEFPVTPQEFQYVADRMKYLRTKEGFEKSNGYDICVRDYPFSTHFLCPTCNGHKKVAGKRTKKMPFNDGKPPMNVPVYIKCPKCKGIGKVKRPLKFLGGWRRPLENGERFKNV